MTSTNNVNITPSTPFNPFLRKARDRANEWALRRVKQQAGINPNAELLVNGRGNRVPPQLHSFKGKVTGVYSNKKGRAALSDSGQHRVLRLIPAVTKTPSDSHLIGSVFTTPMNQAKYEELKNRQNNDGKSGFSSDTGTVVAKSDEESKFSSDTGTVVVNAPFEFNEGTVVEKDKEESDTEEQTNSVVVSSDAAGEEDPFADIDFNREEGFFIRNKEGKKRPPVPTFGGNLKHNGIYNGKKLMREGSRVVAFVPANAKHFAPAPVTKEEYIEMTGKTEFKGNFLDESDTAANSIDNASKVEGTVEPKVKKKSVWQKIKAIASRVFQFFKRIGAKVHDFFAKLFKTAKPKEEEKFKFETEKA